MDRREALGILGGSVAGVMAATAHSARAAQHEHEHEGHQDEHLETLGKCVKLCNEAAHHCLEALKEGGPHADHHVKSHELTMDCQSFCILTATLMMRHSPLSKYAHQACAEACKCCAEECEKGQDQVMKDCAAACTACEKLCRQMSQSA